MLKMYIENLNENNCNCRLNALYKERDKIGERIDKLISLGRYNAEEELSPEYDEVIETISYLCNYRRNHKCLTEGDEGYGFN